MIKAELAALGKSNLILLKLLWFLCKQIGIQVCKGALYHNKKQDNFVVI
jgi:hypothetical protein